MSLTTVTVSADERRAGSLAESRPTRPPLSAESACVYEAAAAASRRGAVCCFAVVSTLRCEDRASFVLPMLHCEVLPSRPPRLALIVRPMYSWICKTREQVE